MSPAPIASGPAAAPAPLSEQGPLGRWDVAFRSERLESRFRQSHLKRSRRLSQIMLLIIGLMIPTFLSSDQAVIQPQHWPLSIGALRLTASLLTLALALRLGRIRLYADFQPLVILWSLAFFAHLLLVQWMLLDDYLLYTLFDVLLLIGFYVSVVLPLPVQIAIALPYAGAALLGAWVGKQMSPHTLAVLASAYLATSAAGIALAAQRHHSLRHSFITRRTLRMQAKRLHELAFRDAMTGAHNRRALADHFPAYLASAARLRNDGRGVFVALADIDHFKSINDRYGHEVGDQVITGFAALLRDSVRPSDHIYRIGGEEFVVVLLDCSEAVARQRIAQIIERLNTPPGLGGEARASDGGPVTASFGLSPLQPEDSLETALKRGDDGLYAAKRAGRNRMGYVPA